MSYCWCFAEWANGEKKEEWTYTTLWKSRGSFLLVLSYLLMCQINRSTSCTKFPSKNVKFSVFLATHSYIAWSLRFFIRRWFIYFRASIESPLDCKEIQPVHSEGDQPWDLFGRNYAKAETPVLWPPHAKSWLIGKDSDAERGAEGEGDDRGWDGWMASPTRWTWVCVNSGCWWWTGRPGVLWFMGSQRVGHEWATELNWTEML